MTNCTSEPGLIDTGTLAGTGPGHIDAFCETIGFTAAQTERLFRAATSFGLPVKIHAEQLSDQKSAILAARYGALSADHLEYLGEDGVAAMANTGTVAVLLPGAFYFLRETRLPPIEALRRAGVPIAVCGEMAGDLQLTRLLLGVGLRNFSMHPAQLPAIKERILRTNLAEVRPLAQRVLRSTDPRRTRELLARLNA